MLEWHTSLSEVSMTVAEFFLYLLDRDASRGLALELVDICELRTRLSQATADSNLVPA